jgi:hypothetical protein
VLLLSPRDLDRQKFGGSPCCGLEAANDVDRVREETLVSGKNGRNVGWV